MAEELFKYVAFSIIIYTLIPTFLARFCSIGVISRLPAKNKVIITFDDGPDPRYTPRVLDILKNAGVNACFFVLGEKARKHPDLIVRIISEGHEIGSHGLKHRIPWLVGPMGSLTEIKGSFQAIEEITGSPPAAFRPPWGLFNLSYYFTRMVMKHKIVLWSFMSWDWSNKITPEIILKKVKKNLIHGSILIFHDSDTEPGASAGSPEKMIHALPEIINELKERGYIIAPLKEFLSNTRPLSHYLMILWQRWEKIFGLAFGLKIVADIDDCPTIFRASLSRYLGPRVILPCGKVLHRGEKVCELHLNNEYMLNKFKGETRPETIGIKTVRELRRSLPALARHIHREPRYKDVECLVAITMLHRGSLAMGFTPVEITSLIIRKVVSLYQSLILNLYHPSERKRVYGKGDLSPKIIVMSKMMLFSKYLK